MGLWRPPGANNSLGTVEANGQPHIWREIQGGGHDAGCVNPLMYNFLKNAFKAGK